MKISIITRCTRPQNLDLVKESVFNKVPEGCSINWHIVFDTSILKDIDAELLTRLSNGNTKFHFKKGDGWGLSQLNELIQNLEGWIYHLDDDNLLHENFYVKIQEAISNNPKCLAIVFSQKVGGIDFSGVDVREADPKNTVVQKIDLAQWVIHSELHLNNLYGGGYRADGEFIQSLYKENPEAFIFIKDILCYYNALEKKSTAKVPKILYIGRDKPELKSLKILDYEADNLEVKYLESDDDIGTHVTIGHLKTPSSMVYIFSNGVLSSISE